MVLLVMVLILSGACLHTLRATSPYLEWDHISASGAPAVGARFMCPAGWDRTEVWAGNDWKEVTLAPTDWGSWLPSMRWLLPRHESGAVLRVTLSSISPGTTLSNSDGKEYLTGPAEANSCLRRFVYKGVLVEMTYARENKGAFEATHSAIAASLRAE